MGMVFQHFGLLPHMTVLDNVAYPLRVQGMPRRSAKARAREMIELVGLTGRETSFPRELSGGMQQRVGHRPQPRRQAGHLVSRRAVQRARSADPPADAGRVPAAAGVLKKTIVFITHDFLEALRLADRIAIMRDGRIVQIGTPAELVLRPADDYVAEFTRDVPRDKVVTAGDIIEPAGRASAPSSSGRPGERGDREVIPLLVGRTAVRWRCVDERANAIIGQISGERVLAALAQRP